MRQILNQELPGGKPGEPIAHSLESPSHPAVAAFSRLVWAAEAGNYQAGRAAIKALRSQGYSVVMLAKGGGQ